MASNVAPGYNPEVSLLQGGTAPIVPVQGGGGMEAGSSPPAGYNPEQSLLNVGQNAPIVAIRGGGQQGGKEGELAYKDYVLERYNPPLTSISLPKVPNPEGKKSYLQAYASFSKDKLKELKSFLIDPQPYASVENDNPTYKICPTPSGLRRLPTNFKESVRKRVVIIKKDNLHIWILPNLKGNLSQFLQYINLIPKQKEGSFDSNHYVLCTGTFFSDNREQNEQFYFKFLDIKVKNMNNLYTINTITDSYIIQACSLLKNAYSETYLGKEGASISVPTFNEPDILIFKNQQILFKNSELPFQRNDMKISISEVLKKPDTEGKYNSFVIVPAVGVNEELPSNTSSAPEEQKYFIFDMNTTKRFSFPSKSYIQCPPDQTCSNFKGGYQLEKISDDKMLDTDGLFHIYIPTTTIPFLHEKEPPKEETKEETKPPEEFPKPPEEAPKPAEEAPKPPEETKEATPRVSLDLSIPPLTFKKKEEDVPFAASATAVKGAEETLEVNARQFKLRIPLNKAVYDNWKKAIFTQNEVDFLNSLQFTPTLLSDTFGKDAWKSKLAEFLEKLLLSSCFQDTRLLTRLECSNAQQFVKQVYFQMYNRLLRSIYTEMGMPTPKKLADIFQILKNIGSAGTPGSVGAFSKYDFTGDLLERFQIIHYDKEKGEYYTDFAELTDATRELLKKLKFYRVEDKDIDEITRAIFEHMKRLQIPGAGVALRGGPSSPPAASKGGPSSPPAESKEEPSSPPSTTYTLDEMKGYDPIPETFFTNIFTADDGLCFPRAVLKGLQENPVPDSVSKKDVPYVYNPDEPTSLAFVREIRDYIRSNKADIKIKNFGAAGEIEVPVEEYFDTRYKPKNGESVDANERANDRIRVGTVYKKLSLEDYLNLLDGADPLTRPFSEVNDAGIGIAAGKLKNKVIVIYNKDAGVYRLRSILNEEMATKPQPISSFLFLEWKDGNHYNLLKIAPGQIWPHKGTEAPKSGGGPEILLAEELLDLGEAIGEEVVAKKLVSGTRNKKKKLRKTRKQNRKQK